MESSYKVKAKAKTVDTAVQKINCLHGLDFNPLLLWK